MNQFEPQIRKEYAQAVYDQIMTGWIGWGKVVKEFEDMFRHYVVISHAIATTSGTSSLLTALYALEIGPGDEVIVSDYSFIAAVNCIRFLGAYPRLVDIRKETLCMDPDKIESLINKNTKAIIFINHNGYVGKDVYKVKDICRKHRIYMIEDSACGLGQWYKGKHAGTIGDIGCFSFAVPKILNTGQGGMIITKYLKYYGRCKEIIDQGSLSWRKNGIHKFIGINFKFNDILASYGLAQFKVLDKLLEKRYEIFSWYLDNGIDIQYFDTDKKTGPWMNIYLADNAEELQVGLKKEGIESKLLYKPVHVSLDRRGEAEFPITEEICEKALYLPSSLNLIKEDVDRISNIIKLDI